MAALSCEACCGVIVNNKSYRKINRAEFTSFFENMGINTVETVCCPCFNKFNKVKNFDTDLKAKVEKWNHLRDDLVISVLELQGIRNKRSTPAASRKKRCITSPTGLTPKSKRGLFTSPKQAKPTTSKPCCATKVHMATQTPTQTNDFKVKVTVKYGGEERSKVITDSLQQAVIKAFLNNSTNSAIMKCLAKNHKYKKAMISTIGRAVKNEVNSICKQCESLMKVTHSVTSEDMLTFDWKLIAQSMNLKLPVLMGVLNSFCENKKKSTVSQLVTAVGVLLYSRNQNLNLLQYVLGIVLDSCGLTKEGLNILHNIGLSVSYSSICKKKKHLINTQEENVKTVVNHYKTSKLTCTGPVESYENNELMAEVSASPFMNICESASPSVNIFEIATPSLNTCESTSTSVNRHVHESGSPSVNICDSATPSLNTCESASPSVKICESATPLNTCESTSTSVNRHVCESASSSVNICESATPSVNTCEITSTLMNTCETNLVERNYTLISSADKTFSVSAGASDINENDKNLNLKGIEILGDNVDITITPASMTLDRQRKSLHWFLLMVKCNRICYNDFSVSAEPPCQPHIMDIGTHEWIPSSDQIKDMKQNFIFHVSQIIRKYVTELEHIKYPDFIQHDFIHLTETKSNVLNCDLIDESENSSSGMIKILQRVHEISVPHVNDNVEERVVFGGDVLTNERAFSAQSAMQNSLTDYERLMGIVHRPEGLHREFNFLQAIYQLFYKESSAIDRGSLYQLRNLINRRDVTGPNEVKERFRPHVQFIDDVTDAYIVSAFMDMTDMEDMTSKPRGMPVFSLLSEEEKIHWLNSMSDRLLDSLQIVNLNCVEQLRQDLSALTQDDMKIESMRIDGIYACLLCAKTYTSHNRCKKHLEKLHKWKFHEVNNDTFQTNPVISFLFMSLLFRDTCNAYKLGDGDRIVRNAYFEWLVDSALRHTKYKLWLWRMITYCISILGTKRSFEYKWNMCMNLKGGIANNIPNDNGVELQVKNIKAQVNTQGVNKCFNSAKKVCMTTQVIDSMKENLVFKTKCVKSKRQRPAVDKSNDISVMVKCLRNKATIEDFKWESFTKFQDPFQCVNTLKLHSWIKEQKITANVYL